MPGTKAPRSLMDLPVEVIELIILAARELDILSPHHMALVCHKLQPIARPLLAASVLLNTEDKILAFAKVPTRAVAHIDKVSMSFPGARNRRTAKLELSPDVKATLISLLPTFASISHIQLPLELLAEVISLRRAAGTLHRLTHVSILASLGKPGQPVLKTTTMLDCAGVLAQLQATHVHVSGTSTTLVVGAAIARNPRMRITHLAYDVYPLTSGSGADFYPPNVMHLLPKLERMIIRLPLVAGRHTTWSEPGRLVMRILSRARKDERLCIHYAGNPHADAEMNQFASDGWRRHANGLEDLWDSGEPLVWRRG